MPWPTLEDHFRKSTPKRILSLDGGGVRGILTLGYLEKIEAILRVRHGDAPDFRLCHYFDLIGGTSTGAIIAGCLAIGMSVTEVTKLYRSLAAAVFKTPWYKVGLFEAKFPAGPLQEALDKTFGNIRLGGNEIKTGLMVMAKRLDSNSPWVIHNHPESKYFAPKPPSTAFPNKLYSLKQLIRASTAAPHFFEPERIQVADGQAGAFVDGGVSPHNNPALQLFMLATLSGYGWKWEMGADHLLLISVGTGDAEARLKTDEVMSYTAANLAARALLSLMDDGSALSQTILQWISRCPTRWQIDREIGDLATDRLGGQELLTYARYNVRFDPAWIARELEVVVDNAIVSGLKQMDDPKNLDELYRMGQAGSEKQVKDEHFAGFDVKLV